MDHELALVSLKKFVACLNVNFKNKFFIVDGTLLGLVRDGGFIVGDHDIDLGMWIEDHDDRILADLQSAGFKLMRSYGDMAAGLMYMFQDGDIKIDLMFYYRQVDHYWVNLYTHGKKLKATYRVFNLEAANFHGIDVQMPFPPEKYLTDIYGPAWMVPAAKWSYKYSAHNLRADGGAMWRCVYRLKCAWQRWRMPEIYSARRE